MIIETIKDIMMSQGFSMFSSGWFLSGFVYDTLETKNGKRAFAMFLAFAVSVLAALSHG